MATYYYLVASLPVLNLDTDKIKFNLDEIFESIRSNINKEDLDSLEFLLHLNDIKNLVKVILEAHQFRAPHNNFTFPANFSEDTLNEYHLNLDVFPPFMQLVIEENEDLFISMDPLRIENLFLESYYELAMNNSNEFIRYFLSFDLSLKNIITAINCRKKGEIIEDFILEDEETSQVLLKSSARDFGLSDKFPFINQLEELVDNGYARKLESFVDMLRWSFCDELTSNSFFKIDNLLAYTVKLIILKRRLEHDPERGRERLNELTQKAVMQLEIPVG